jgi:uncharacterized membrane protein YccC
MPKITRAAVLFSVNSFAASMLALFIAFSIGLPRPYWAMTTAYIVSQPLAGAVRSKAAYRIMGTLVGAAAAVALVPSLVDAPVLLSLALALWVGGCLAISLLDRTPRSYLLMLAGYTAAIIGFPSVSQPGAVFDVAVSRVVEIGLGIVCATLVHSLVFPRPVGDAFSARATAWLADADRWALDLLAGRDEAASLRDRRHMAAAASEIQILASHLPFDTSRLRETTAVVQVLNDRMLLLIPILSGVSDRLAALRLEAGQLDAGVGEAVGDIARWIEDRAPADRGAELAARLAAFSPRGTSWRDLLTESLAIRLSDLVVQLGEAHALLAHLRAHDTPLPQPLAQAVAGATARRMHRDPGMAILSGAAAAIAILLTCAIWIQTGWGDGASAAVMAAIFCCFFATLDDPAPAILQFGLASVIVLPVSALYLFAILPAIDSFLMLALVLAPVLLLLGLLVPNPKTAGASLAMILGFSNALALTETFTADAAAFLNANLGQFVGMFTAVFVTRTIRSMSVDASVQRLLRQTWRGLAELARGAHAPAPAAFAARLVDRLGLLTPKLAQDDASGDAIGAEALRHLRVGMNIVALQQSRAELSGAARHACERLLAGVADHFAARSAGRETVPPAQLLIQLDQALSGLARSDSAAARAGAPGLVGLRRNLFPKAPAFTLAARESLA